MFARLPAQAWLCLFKGVGCTSTQACYIHADYSKAELQNLKNKNKVEVTKYRVETSQLDFKPFLNFSKNHPPTSWNSLKEQNYGIGLFLVRRPLFLGQSVPSSTLETLHLRFVSLELNNRLSLSERITALSVPSKGQPYSILWFAPLRKLLKNSMQNPTSGFPFQSVLLLL